MREAIHNLLEGSNRVTLWIGGLAIFVMTILGAADVIMNALFKQPIHSTVEMTETLCVIVIWLGLGTVHEKRAHIATDILYLKLPARIRKAPLYCSAVPGNLPGTSTIRTRLPS